MVSDAEVSDAARRPGDAAGAARLLLGPVLRYVDEHRATVWVETDRPCEVELDVADAASATARTFSVHGHHYALVVVTGLPSGRCLPYEVRLDGHRRWPAPEGPDLPPSSIRTRPADGDARLRLSFGSCRRAADARPETLRELGADALVALATRMASVGQEDWPDLLLFIGDQVYADAPSDNLLERVERLRELVGSAHPAVRGEIGTYEEYAHLYRDSWGQPQVRWLLSTVPTCMLLDDHDLRDDWNTSLAWRERVSQAPWWRGRVTAAFASYWVYQHLGNLSPDDIATDRLWQRLHAAADDAERDRLVDEFAWAADVEPASMRWSFHRDLGTTRLVAVDSRCARVVDPARRRMVDEPEWEWVREQVLAPGSPAGRPRHLVLATPLPVFLPHGLHHLEGWDEAVAQGAWGARWARAGEWLRQAVDLEHWAAFRASYARFVALLGEVAALPRDDAPASVLILSGDVHCSYSAEVRLPGVDPARTAVHQLVMSPFRNPLERLVRLADLLAGTMPVRGLTRWMSRAAGVREPEVTWRVGHGPWFDNGTMTLELAGGRAVAEVDHALVVGSAQVLSRTVDIPLQG